METKNLLKSFGLSNYEAEVYAALLKVERAKVQELVKMVSVPRPQIYLTLKKLVNKGMCIENKGKVTHYTAVAPSIAFQGILKNEREMLQAKEQVISKLNRIFKKRTKGVVPLEFVQVLKGQQIREFLKRVVNEVKKEIMVFFKFPTEKNEKELEDAVKLEVSVLKKGVRVRCLYDAENLNPPQADRILPYVKRLLREGEQGRVVNTLPMNMLIADDKAATFSLTHRAENEVTVFLFNHPALISVMKDGFEYLWAKGTDINKVITKVERTSQSQEIGNRKLLLSATGGLSTQGGKK